MNLVEHPWSAVFLAGFAVYVGIRHVHIERAKGVTRTVRRIDATEKLLMALVGIGNLLLPLVYVLTPLLDFADVDPPAAVPWCGLVVMVLALWLFWRSHADLGLNWSMSLELREGHELVRHGVYRRLRHPMYASIFLFGLAQALLLPNWLAGWSALASFAPMYLVRAPREERMLREAFGPAYDEYAGRSGRILPRWR